MAATCRLSSLVATHLTNSHRNSCAAVYSYVLFVERLSFGECFPQPWKEKQQNIKH